MASKLTEVFDNVRSFFTGRVDDDKIKGGIGNDELDGGAGDDTLAGFMGHDHLDGGEGDDFLAGMRGKDYLDGGEGDDFLDGGRGRDHLVGGAGDDVLLGGGGTDTLTGGTGNDTFVQDFSLSGRDDITDFNPAEDTIDIRGLQNISEISVTAENGGTLIDGGTGNTLFVANITPDQLSADNVTIDGNAITFGPGDTLEKVLGDAAADQQGDDLNIRGFGGDQNFTGGAGNDTLGAADGNDTLAGGAGDDILAGGAGDDILTGGQGGDTFEHNFRQSGSDTITDFDPSQDTINIKGLKIRLPGDGNRIGLETGEIDDISRISLTEVDGGTRIEVASGSTPGSDTSGSTLFVEGVTPDQLGAGNITIEGTTLTAGPRGSDLGSIISDLSALNDETPVDETPVDEAVVDEAVVDLKLRGGGGDDTLEGGAGDDTLVGGRGADTFVQNFSEPGADTITDFNPGQDTINFTGLNDLDSISVEEADGGTLISAGEGNTLFVKGVTLDEFSVDNVRIDGQEVSAGLGGLDLGGALGDAASEPLGAAPDALDASLGESLDASTSQGGSVAGSQAEDSAQEQAGAVSEAVADEAAAEEEAVDEAAAGA